MSCFPGHDQDVLHWLGDGSLSRTGEARLIRRCSWTCDDLAGGSQHPRLFGPRVPAGGAFHRQRIDVLRAWLDIGTSVDARSELGTTLLVECLRNAAHTCASDLLGRGASVGDDALELELLLSPFAAPGSRVSLSDDERALLTALLLRKHSAPLLMRPWPTSPLTVAGRPCTTLTFVLTRLPHDAKTLSLLRAHVDDEGRDLMDVAERSARSLEERLSQPLLPGPRDRSSPPG